jgi:hypothetical protein
MSGSLRLCFLVILFSMGAFAQAQPQVPDSTTQVSLVTIGPGGDLYSGFGHSLLWFDDPAKGIELAYNYGTFSFQEGNFYVKFLRGTLPYAVSRGPLIPQLDFYAQVENRSITQQVLNLSTAQKQKLFALLNENYLPQNRVYAYRFFYDNCATRLQDMVIAACGSDLRYSGYTHETRTFREWIDKYAYRQNPWADFGMDLAIGKPADETATPMQATFLPDNLHDAFADAQVMLDGTLQPLVKARNVLYSAKERPAPGFFTPSMTFWLLAIAVGLFTFGQLKTNSINFIFDKVLFNLCAVAGVFLLFLWFGTNHEDTVRNWDILWANPLLFFIAWGLSSKRKKSWVSVLLIVYGFLLLAGTINIDKHNQVLVPILLMLIIRLYYVNTSMTKIPES